MGRQNEMEVLDQVCTLRTLVSSDTQMFRDLRHEALKTCPGTFENSFEDYRDKPACSYEDYLSSNWGIGCFINDELAGMIFFTQTIGGKVHHRGSIYNLYVAKDHRRRGIAESLLEAIKLYCKRSNITQIELYVSSAAKQALKFYERSGFRICGVIPEGIIVGEDAYDINLMICKMNIDCVSTPSS